MNNNYSFHLRTFHEKSLHLLEEDDREILHNILKEYQQLHDVTRLVVALTTALDSPQKLDLLKDLRSLIPTAHLAQFDRLAPFERMANPFRPPKVKAKKGRGFWGHRQHLLNGISVDSLEKMGRLVTVHLTRESTEDGLGFTIRGGSEHGLGIFVSQVEQGSNAESSGLCVGDQIMEVNSLSLHNFSSATALHILADSACLRVLVKRLGKVPGFKFAKEKTAWYDVTRHRIVQGSLNDHGTYQYPSNKRMLTINEFRVHLRLTSTEAEFGFNIRGGSEYGLGIFISSVDPGGLAQSCGLKPGQQLVDVNGVDFESICHALAVEIIRSNRQLVLTMRDVGRYPAYKELYAKFSWHAEAAVSAVESSHSFRARSHGDLSSGLPSPALRRHRSSLSSLPSLPSHRDLALQTEGLDRSWGLEPLAVEVWENKGTQTFATEAAWPEDDDVILVNNQSSQFGSIRQEVSPMPPQRTPTPLPQVAAEEMAANGTLLEPELSDDVTRPESGEAEKKEDRFTERKGSWPAESSIYSVLEERIVPRLETSAPSILSGRPSRALPSDLPAALRPSDFPLSGQARFKAFRSKSETELALDEVDEVAASSDVEQETHDDLGSPSSPQPADGKPTGTSLRRKSTFRDKFFGSKKNQKLRNHKKDDSAGAKTSSIRSSGGSIFSRLGVRMRRRRSEDRDFLSRQKRDSEPGKWSTSPSDNSTLKSSSSSATNNTKEANGLHSSYRRRDINELAVEEMARKLFSKNDRKQMLRHVAMYASCQSGVETLGRSVLPLLAKAEQVLILRELRGVLRPTDVGRFDSMVGPTEVAAYEELASRKAAKSAKLSPHPGAEGPPKKLLMEPVPDNRGHYYLQTPEEYRLDQERRKEIERLRKEKERGKRSPRPSPAASGSGKLYLKKHEGKKAVRIRDSPFDIEIIPNHPDDFGSLSDNDDASGPYDQVAFSPEPPDLPVLPPTPRQETESPDSVQNLSPRGPPGKYAVVKRRAAPKPPPARGLKDSFASEDTGLGAESPNDTGDSAAGYELYSIRNCAQATSKRSLAVGS